MSATFGKSGLATLTGANATNPNATIMNISASSADTSVVAIGTIAGNTIQLNGVSNGTAEVTFMATDKNGVALPPVTDSITITNITPVTDDIATSFSVAYTETAA